MFRLVKGLRNHGRKLKEVNVREEVMESCVSLRRKEVMSGKIIWRGP